MALRISDLTPFTTLDFPGCLAAVVWCRGCPLDCAYCHNPDLRAPCSAVSDPPWERALDFLRHRRGVLDGVVFSGGEPLMQGALPEAMEQVRALGYKVALHTAGMTPIRFARVLPLCDWVGFDAKAPFSRYEIVTGVKGSGDKALESLRMLLASGTAHEVRTTVDSCLMSEEDMTELAGSLAVLGVRVYRLQDVSGTQNSVSQALADRIAPMFADFEIRRGASALPNPDRRAPASADARYPLSGAGAG